MPFELPPKALPAWNAYLAMIASKQRHFDFLKALEQKYERYGQPDTAEQAELQQLLANHDDRVKTFNVAIRTLKIEDTAAYAALVARLAEGDEGTNGDTR